MSTPFNAKRNALIIIDMQRDFCSPKGYAAKAGLDVSRLSSVIANVRRLLDFAREMGFMVVHTREGHLPDLSDCPANKLRRSELAGAAIGSQGPLGRLLIRGEYGHDFVDELQPQDGEFIIDKPGYGAFHATQLQEKLTACGIDQLIICGVTTEVCVHSTLREAIDHGYACITVSDATASSNAQLQNAALAMIAVEGNIFGKVFSTREIISSIR